MIVLFVHVSVSIGDIFDISEMSNIFHYWAAMIGHLIV